MARMMAEMMPTIRGYTGSGMAIRHSLARAARALGITDVSKAFVSMRGERDPLPSSSGRDARQRDGKVIVQPSGGGPPAPGMR
jgi:hypothetical protein